MSVTETLNHRQQQIEGARDEVAQLQEALDRTDSVLAHADDALAGAQQVAEQTRRVAPAIAVVLAVAVGATIAVVIVRRRRRRQD